MLTQMVAVVFSLTASQAVPPPPDAVQSAADAQVAASQAQQAAQSARNAAASAAAAAAQQAAQAAQEAAAAAVRAAAAAQQAAGLPVTVTPAAPPPATAAPVPVPTPVAQVSAPPAPAPGATVSPPTIQNATKLPSWTANFGANIIWLQGNSNSLTYSANVALTRNFEDGWIVGGKAWGTYGQTEAAGTTTTSVNALNAGGQLRGERVIVPETSVYLMSGTETDHVASLEVRYWGEAGAGIYWLDRKEGDFQKLLLRTDIGFHVGRDDRFQYFPSATDPGSHSLPALDFVGPKVGEAFRYAINKDEIFTQDASLMENIDGQSRTIVTSATKLSSRIAHHVALAVSFLVAYDSEPAIGKLSTDTALTLGLEGSF